MKKVYVSDKTKMVLESIKNIDKEHKLYDTFYEKEVDDDFHVNVFENATVRDNAIVCDNARATSRVYNINFLQYNVTLTDNHIQIGCKQFTYEKAIKFSKRDIGKHFDEHEYNRMIGAKKLIMEAIKLKRPDLFKGE